MRGRLLSVRESEATPRLRWYFSQLERPYGDVLRHQPALAHQEGDFHRTLIVDRRGKRLKPFGGEGVPRKITGVARPPCVSRCKVTGRNAKMRRSLCSDIRDLSLQFLTAVPLAASRCLNCGPPVLRLVGRRL